MSPSYWNGTWANVFFVYGSSNPGYLNWNNVNNTNGVVRPSNFSLKNNLFITKFIVGLSFRETNIILCHKD